MAYGRLDVFWPDGRFQTFPLVENNISIGRSSGNTVALDTTTLSRYHFSITHDGQQVFITDLESVNGTFVDGEKLTTNQPRLLDGGEEIQVGHLRLIYHHIDEMPTQPIRPVEEATQRIEVEATDFRVDVIGPDRAFSPGAHMSAEVSITNTRPEAQIYRIEVTGMPPEWIRIDRPELEIEANDTAQVNVNFRPLRRSDSKPGDYTVALKVSRKDQPESKIEALLALRILPFSGFGIALEASRVVSGQPFRLHLHNQGSAPLPITLSGKDRDGRLAYSIQPSKTSLSPGQRLVVQGEVKPLKPVLIGKPHEHAFDLQVRSQDSAQFLAAVRGYLIEKPMLPAWFPFVAAAIALLVGILLLVVLISFLRPIPKPEITRFDVNPTQVAQGQPLALNWAARDVEALSVSVNGTPFLSDISPETSGLNLETNDLSGSVVIVLNASNQDQTVSASQTVQVYQPLGEFRLTIEPLQVVRYVVQNIDLSWNVVGAVKTQLSGLETFSTTPLQQQYGGEGEIRGLAGIPADTLRILLSAADSAGNTQQQAYDVPVINPECLPVGASVTLYAGPDVRYQVVGTVPAGAFVVVDAQDGSGQWLRAQLPGGLSGWGVRSEFSCAQTFNPADLVKELNVPTLPPPTATLPSTPTLKPPPPTLVLTATPVPTLPPVSVPPTAAG